LYEPAFVIERSENVATPATAALVNVPDSVCADGATVTFAVLPVRLPNWSRSRTVTAGVIGWPATVLVGCWAMAR
jgi:hypothetical protein